VFWSPMLKTETYFVIFTTDKLIRKPGKQEFDQL